MHADLLKEISERFPTLVLNLSIVLVDFKFFKREIHTPTQAFNKDKAKVKCKSNINYI